MKYWWLNASGYLEIKYSGNYVAKGPLFILSCICISVDPWIVILYFGLFTHSFKTHDLNTGTTYIKQVIYAPFRLM